MYKHILFFCVYVCLRVLNLRWDILVLVDSFQNVQSHTEHFVLSQWRLELASIAETERLNWNDNRLCWLKKMVSAYLTVGWRGSHSKNLVHRNGLTVRTLEAKRFLVWRFFEGSKCAEWKFWKNKKVLSDCPSVYIHPYEGFLKWGLPPSHRLIFMGKTPHWLGPSVVPSLDVMFSRPQTKGPVAYRADEPLANTTVCGKNHGPLIEDLHGFLYTKKCVILHVYLEFSEVTRGYSMKGSSTTKKGD